MSTVMVPPSIISDSEPWIPSEQLISLVLAVSIPIKSGSGSLIVAVPKLSSIIFPALSVHRPLSFILTEYAPPSKASTVKTWVV